MLIRPLPSCTIGRSADAPRAEIRFTVAVPLFGKRRKPAAATDAVGVVRRDPMAMLPFAGYNFGDYWSHWIDVGAKLKSPPQIFHVNWFRRSQAGSFLWPGYGENLRVLRWIIDRCKGTAKARDTAIGQLPSAADLDLQGLDIAPEALDELLTVNPALWRQEFAGFGKYLDEFGTRVPAPLKAELNAAIERVHSSQV